MSWLSKLFGGKRPEPEPAPVRATIQVKTYPRPTPKPKDKPKTPPVARGAEPSLDVDGWVGWNFTAQVDIAGIQHHKEAATKAYNSLRPGDVVELVRSPENPHDPNAIEVRFRGELIGYLERDLAALAAERMSKETPIRAEYMSGHIGKSGFVRITILPLVPDNASRKRNGWKVASR